MKILQKYYFNNSTISRANSIKVLGTLPIDKHRVRLDDRKHLIFGAKTVYFASSYYYKDLSIQEYS